MQLIKISLIALLSGYVMAQDIDNSDVPYQCRSVCASVISLTQTCDRRDDDTDSSFINCVCSSTNAGTLMPECEACVANFDRDDGSDNDVNDLVRSCSFTRVAYASTTAGTSGTGSLATASSTSSNIFISGTGTVVSASATGTTSQLPTATNRSPDGSSTTTASRVVSSVVSSLSASATPTVAGSAGAVVGVKDGVVVAGLVVAAWGLV